MVRTRSRHLAYTAWLCGNHPRMNAQVNPSEHRTLPSLPRETQKRHVLRARDSQDVTIRASEQVGRAQSTSARTMAMIVTLWALCTAIPIQALRYRFDGYARMNVSRSAVGIAHGMCRW